VAPRCLLAAGDGDGLPAREKEGEWLGEVGSPKWGADGSSGGGSARAGSSGAPWCLAAAPYRRSYRRHGRMDVADGRGFPRTVSSDAGAVRCVGRLRAPAVGSSNRGEKGTGSGDVCEENGGGGGVSSGAPHGGKEEDGSLPGSGAGKGARRSAQRGSAGAGAKGGPGRGGPRLGRARRHGPVGERREMGHARSNSTI
jgi:hypothetical protein